ncbi:unnamed protein product [Urochloa humidicola]
MSARHCRWEPGVAVQPALVRGEDQGSQHEPRDTVSMEREASRSKQQGSVPLQSHFRIRSRLYPCKKTAMKLFIDEGTEDVEGSDCESGKVA